MAQAMSEYGDTERNPRNYAIAVDSYKDTDAEVHNQKVGSCGTSEGDFFKAPTDD